MAKQTQVSFVLNSLNKGQAIKVINLAMINTYDNTNNCPIIYRVIRAMNRLDIPADVKHLDLLKAKIKITPELITSVQEQIKLEKAKAKAKAKS